MATKKTKKKPATNLKRKALVDKSSVKNPREKNAAGANQFAVSDPAEKLISMIGSSFLNEGSSTYGTPETELATEAYDPAGLDAHTQQIINTATQVAKSDHPEDLLKIARWARTELKVRSTPTVLLAVAAECPETKQFVRKYTPLICQRPDEVKQAFIAYRQLFGTEDSLPNSLKRGLSDRISKMRESDFLKYEGQERPYWSDIIRMVDRSKDWPVSQATFNYLYKGETDPEKTPVFFARKALNQLKTFDEKAQSLAKASYATWENVLSQFGNSKDVWEYLVKSGQLGYMALIRNLRNMLQAGVSMATVNAACDALVSGAVNSKQLPYRFLSAYKQLEGINTPECTRILGALASALDAVVANMPRLPGNSLIACDTSGSMSSTVSDKSTVTRKEAACILGAIAYKLSEGASEIGAFSNEYKTANVNPGMTTLEIARRVGDLDVGAATMTHLVFDHATKSSTRFKRCLLFSDMQAYDKSISNVYGRGQGGSAATSLSNARKKNGLVYLHSVDLAGQGTSLTKQSDTNTNLVGGYSEKVIDTVLAFEGIKKDATSQTVTGDEATSGAREFTLEYIRKNF